MEAEAHGFAAMRPDYERYFALTGKNVTVSDGTTRVSGCVTGVDAEGALMLETNHGRTADSGRRSKRRGRL